MYAIKTKYHGPSNTKGSRMSADWNGTRVIIPYRHNLNTENNHKAAAERVIQKHLRETDTELGKFIRHQRLIGSQLEDCVYVWVFDDGRLEALRGMVNSMRKATWTGNPWNKPEFSNAVKTIGRAFGYYGIDMMAPTTDEEIAKYEKV